VAWRDFAYVAAEMLWSMLDGETAARRSAAVAAVAATEGSQALAALRGMDRSVVYAVLASAFKEADADGSGTLELEEVETVLRGLVDDGSGGVAIPPKAGPHTTPRFGSHPRPLSSGMNSLGGVSVTKNPPQTGSG